LSPAGGAPAHSGADILSERASLPALSAFVLDCCAVLTLWRGQSNPQYEFGEICTNEFAQNKIEFNPTPGMTPGSRELSGWSIERG